MDEVIQCPRCKGSTWVVGASGVRCPGCAWWFPYGTKDVVYQAMDEALEQHRNETRNKILEDPER